MHECVRKVLNLSYTEADQFEGTLVSVKKERPSEDNRIVDMQEKENFEVVHTAIQTGYFRREAIRKSCDNPAGKLDVSAFNSVPDRCSGAPFSPEFSVQPLNSLQMSIGSGAIDGI
ncbi:hypothetical protein PC129_g19870 [Phytophthora cactorum]|uniref:Uncharacterized protein n=1 Tax=Phytophthora cactorum TaxID=29920 RepID=A0A8T1HA64_9STRA|nr:hypothetical protein PC129_g19870 [Phytophthora cactorum]